MFRRILRAAGIIAILCFFAYSLVVPRGGPPVGQPAPAVSGDMLDGSSLDLAVLKGRVTVIDFWATWCPPCVRSLPALQALHRRYAGDSQVSVISVNLDEGEHLERRVRTFMKERRYDFPVLLDEHKRISGAYGVETIPTMVIVDAEGLVHRVKVGLYSNDPDRIVDHVVVAVEDAQR